MNDYQYLVKITAVTEEQADQVIAERINHEEDYGFVYAIAYKPFSPEDLIDGSLERAPWWREVTDHVEVITHGCPVRVEYPDGSALEYKALRKLVSYGETIRIFIDTRWSPPEPPKPLEVGDVTVAVEGLQRLLNKTARSTATDIPGR